MSVVGRKSKIERLDDYSSGFLRQRRNFILASLIIVFYKYAAVSIDQVSTGFLLLTIGKKKAVIHFLWAMWGYFLLRYFQYERRENENNSRFLWMIKYAVISGVEKYNNHRVDIVNKNYGSLALLNRLGPPVHLLPFYHRIYEANFTKQSRKNPHAEPKKTAKTFEYNVLQLVPAVTWSLAHDTSNYLWRSANFTDYYFPYVLALTAFIYQVFL